MTQYFLQAFIYLIAAVIAVPVAKRLGLGSVLGYLIAGVFIGPVLHLVGNETTTIQHFAEFGVVMMLFLVGLELEPKALWAMKGRLIGLGGMQVGFTALFICAITSALGQPLSVALVVGLIFALSSTAIVLQTFQEKGLQQTEGGKNAFSVLLFQDIAVIPMLAIIPLLALPELAAMAQESSAHDGDNISLVKGLPGWLYGLIIIGSVALVTVGGHYLSRPLFKFVASSGLREIFTATALMLIIGIAALMSLVGLSPALGAFLSGVVLANSEFRHELEANIEPFKGLLLGLFFITVGAGIDVKALTESPVLILSLTVLVMAVKALVLYIIARVFNLQDGNKWLFTLSLAQAGEFGFVLLSFSAQNNVLPNEIIATLSLVVALSMFLTPGLFILFDKVILPRLESQCNERQADTIDQPGSVIIAGIGRFGQIVNRLLIANDFKTVVLDIRSEQIDAMRKIGTHAYFGDASKPDMLHTAGIEQTSLMVVAINNRETAVEMVKYIKHAHPHVRVLARAFDRGHGYRLRQAGADFTVSETYHSALELGAEALRSLGRHHLQVARQKAAYNRIEAKQSDTLYKAWKDDASGERVDNNYLKLFAQLESLIQQALNEDADDKLARPQSSGGPASDKTKGSSDRAP
ncbi:monovalent cation:proton antiporter-2 (CPA2) family protein [Alteromonas sp. C1M14]|uniref:monovalent cation:proton antiporter-2 (CPA2) family protein n=1 Tax=Alteromonas sp. C1M14 TaxID=2841567 RepID=UPI001C08438F|nr:monovalent cation:proton antiporter-2 (CPA2) family protein [Alteromonas sp. C1M14]MBU2979266.1 monovalent cation:proton antiporter-2 (CPA2) family protein [Alteromonas sp. C1M14]